MTRSILPLFGGVLAAALLAGCSGASPQPVDDPGQVTEPPVLDASITQFRDDEGTRNLRAGVTNIGHTTVTVSTATLDYAGFSPTSVDVGDWVLAPGDTAGFDVEYGDPRCDGDPGQEADLVVVVDGVERTLPLRVEDPELLARLHRQECAEERLDATAAVTLELEERPVRSAGEEYLYGDVVVRRQPGSSVGVRVVDLGGSVLLHLEPRSDDVGLPVRLPSGQDQVRLPVRVGSAHRCDAHALGNSSQTFLLSVYVRLDGAPVQRVVTVPDRSSKDLLNGIIRRDCR